MIEQAKMSTSMMIPGRDATKSKDPFVILHQITVAEFSCIHN